MARASGGFGAFAVVGLRELQRDLKAMDPAAARETRLMVKATGQPMRRIAKAQAGRRTRTGEYEGAFTLRQRGPNLALINPLPQALPLEFGGTIAPKGAPISLAPPTQAVWGEGGALEEGKRAVELNLQIGFARLASQYGWH